MKHESYYLAYKICTTNHNQHKHKTHNKSTFGRVIYKERLDKHISSFRIFWQLIDIPCQFVDKVVNSVLFFNLQESH